MTVWLYDCMTMTIWLHDCMTAWLYDCMTAWLYDCMTVWLYECMTVWLYDCMNVWLYDCMTIWLYDCMTAFNFLVFAKIFFTKHCIISKVIFCLILINLWRMTCRSVWYIAVEWEQCQKQLQIYYKNILFIIVLLYGATAPSGPGPSHYQGFKSTFDTPYTLGLLWTSDQPDAETSTWQHITFTRDIHAPGGIRTRNPSKWAAADPRLKPRGHCDRLIYTCYKFISDGTLSGFI
jgi:hypothetical protein